ncbi:MAG: phosphoribosylanthranilate isomerase [Candidatus Omnitrophota bacterium]
MTKVKICGITNLADARASINAGCDALGFVFFRKSPRYIKPAKAKAIIKNLPKNILKIGVFVNSKEKTIKRIAKFCGLDILQFHGNESTEFCRRFISYKVIKAIRVKDKVDLKYILKYNPFAYLFDAFMESKPGGTGKKFDWRFIGHLDGIKKPVFLSGGLSADNVKKAIEIVNPDWVDVSSSVEVGPGKKDQRKLLEFVRKVKL